MSESDPRRGGDEPHDFIEAQDGDYEPAPAAFDEDDLPIDSDELDADEVVPDDDRRVPLDADDVDVDDLDVP
ncbi:hypothetical protein [Leifsonia poae]|uniref:hypothetical protein n=1 Tax=Leifsonia poae TaxID=110933 RepID=UPI001CBC56E6|nr:hypothetical protein [Leifsonia poae]